MIAGWTQKPTLITESGSFYNSVFFFDEMKKREAITLSWQEVKIKKRGGVVYDMLSSCFLFGAILSLILLP